MRAYAAISEFGSAMETLTATKNLEVLGKCTWKGGKTIKQLYTECELNVVIYDADTGEEWSNNNDDNHNEWL